MLIAPGWNSSDRLDIDRNFVQHGMDTHFSGSAALGCCRNTCTKSACYLVIERLKRIQELPDLTP